MTGLLLAAVVIGAIGIIIGVLLGIASEKVKVEVDEKEILVRAELPGNNCGGCGFPGCDGLAAAIAAGTAPVNGCPVGGAPVEDKIAAIMGVESGSSEKKVAFVKCKGTCDKTNVKYNYYGITDCSMVTVAPGSGEKACAYGCMGYGSCVKACQFDAIHIVDGVAVVDKELCKACGACAKVCPNNLIELVPYEGSDYHVRCANRDRGKAVMEGCDAGCISCRKCEKNCPAGAIKVVDNIAHIDYELCVNCGKCMEECPKGCIAEWEN